MSAFFVGQDLESSLAMQIVSPGPRKKEMEPEELMRGLAPDGEHPVALELVGGADGGRFIARSTTLTGIQHLEMRLRTGYPGMVSQTVYAHDDPLRLEPQEEVSVAELEAEGKGYLLLHALDEYDPEWRVPNPLRGVLDALRVGPEDLRAVVQVALLPEQPGRLRQLLHREAREAHEPDEAPLPRKAPRISGGNAPSWSRIISMLVVLVVFLVIKQYPGLVPPGVWQVLVNMMSGKTPSLSLVQLQQTIMIGALVLFGTFGLLILLAELRRRMFSSKKTIANNDSMVEDRVNKGGYRVRIRLYVFSPRYLPHEGRSPIETPKASSVWELLDLRREQNARDGQRQAVLQQLVETYRQFYVASETDLKPRRCSGKEAKLLLRSSDGKQGWTSGIRRSKFLIIADSLVAFWRLPQPVKNR
jgi:hypothetical protein